MALKIIVDTREKIPWDFNDVETLSAKLDTGDYSVEGLEDKICIERKSSLSEFYGNITQKRFWNEMDRIKKIVHKFIIFEFDLAQVNVFPYGCGLPQKVINKLKVSSSYLLSCIIRLQLDYNINVVFAGDRKQAIIISNKILHKVYTRYN